MWESLYFVRKASEDATIQLLRKHESRSAVDQPHASSFERTTPLSKHWLYLINATFTVSRRSFKLNQVLNRVRSRFIGGVWRFVAKFESNHVAPSQFFGSAGFKRTAKCYCSLLLPPPHPLPHPLPVRCCAAIPVMFFFCEMEGKLPRVMLLLLPAVRYPAVKWMFYQTNAITEGGGGSSKLILPMRSQSKIRF